MALISSQISNFFERNNYANKQEVIESYWIFLEVLDEIIHC